MYFLTFSQKINKKSVKSVEKGTIVVKNQYI